MYGFVKFTKLNSLDNFISHLVPQKTTSYKIAVFIESVDEIIVTKKDHTKIMMKRAKVTLVC